MFLSSELQHCPRDVEKLSRYRSFPRGLRLQDGLKQLTQNILVIFYVFVSVSVHCLTNYPKQNVSTPLNFLHHAHFLTEFN